MLRGKRTWLNVSAYVLAWSVIRILVVNASCSVRFDNVDKSLTNCDLLQPVPQAGLTKVMQYVVMSI